MNIFVHNISQLCGYPQESAGFRPHAAQWLQEASLKAAHMPSIPWPTEPSLCAYQDGW